MSIIKLRVPGSTSNLGSGFDTLGLAIDLHLIVRFELLRNGFEIHARGEGAETILQMEHNLIVVAFDRLCRELGRERPPLRIDIENRLPLKRGLGSSGAAIIAGLVAANLFFDEKFSAMELLEMACDMEHHPENASASLLGGLTVNGVENGRLQCARFVPPSEWVAACFVPDLEIATSEGRALLPEMIAHRDAVQNVQRVATLVAAFAKHEPSLLRFGVQDFLHQPYRRSLVTGFNEICAAADAAGAYASFLSGSGSTIIAIGPSQRGKKIANAMATAAAQFNLAGKSLVLKFARDGVDRVMRWRRAS
jgi:homoserine kinase